MASTPYSKNNKAFSDEAHIAARTLIYPRLFKTDAANITYEQQGEITTARWGALDGDMSIDRIVKVKVDDKRLRQSITFTVQERFRDPGSAWRQDVTITAWNNNSNLPSELYKIQANLFLYAYYGAGAFTDAICVNVTDLLMAIAQKAIDFDDRNNPRSNQTFFAFKFDALHKAGLVVYRQKVVDFAQPADAQIRALFAGMSQSEQLKLMAELMVRVASANDGKQSA
jgi:hypothetical protein